MICLPRISRLADLNTARCSAIGNPTHKEHDERRSTGIVAVAFARKLNDDLTHKNMAAV